MSKISSSGARWSARCTVPSKPRCTSAVAIGDHIIAQEGFRRPADNQDVFAALAEEHIVLMDLLPRLVAMAKFRNLIVHDYARIDDSAVFGILKRRLGDLDEYARAIVAHLAWPAEG